MISLLGDGAFLAGQNHTAQTKREQQAEGDRCRGFGDSGGGGSDGNSTQEIGCASLAVGDGEPCQRLRGEGRVEREVLRVKYVSAEVTTIGTTSLRRRAGSCSASVHNAEDLLCGRAVDGIGEGPLVVVADISTIDESKGFGRAGRSGNGHGRARLVSVRPETVEESVNIGDAKYTHRHDRRYAVSDAREVFPLAVGGNVKGDAAEDAGAEDTVIGILSVEVSVQIAVLGKIGDVSGD